MHKCTGKGSPAKKTAWKWFSLYIRLRDCLKTTGSPYSCRCITCDRVVSVDDIDSGHGISGRTNGILFDEKLVNGQCTTCNRTNGGEYQKYKQVLVEKYGLKWYEDRERARKSAVQLGEVGFRLIADHYRKEYNKLLKENDDFV